MGLIRAESNQLAKKVEEQIASLFLEKGLDNPVIFSFSCFCELAKESYKTNKQKNRMKALMKWLS
jgi:hypothetical protein